MFVSVYENVSLYDNKAATCKDPGGAAVLQAVLHEDHWGPGLADNPVEVEDVVVLGHHHVRLRLVAGGSDYLVLQL